MPTRIFLYGPPGSGKSAVGRRLAAALNLPFHDLDGEIQQRYQMTIPQLFQREGEAGFRQREAAMLRRMAEVEGVIALGGGALLDEKNRRLAETAGKVICLSAPLEALLQRLLEDVEQRPLLAGDLRSRLAALLEKRAAHYASFPLQVETVGRSVEETAWEAQVRLGMFHVAVTCAGAGMGEGYDVRVAAGGLDELGELLVQRGMKGTAALVCDENVAPLYGNQALQALATAGIRGQLVRLPAGEQNKTMASVQALWEAFLDAGMDRGSSVLALGGGVIGDLAGFAAATYLRGVAWAAAPTSLLAMVDASLGGKTGADLPRGKNLVGAFYPPRLVLADTRTLETLPEAELRSGLAEVVKAGVIGDERLFNLCARGWQVVLDALELIVPRAMAVKIKVVQADPYEKGVRAALNLGHTVGHALEAASGYRLRHGEAVSIGMVIAARLAERLGIAKTGLSQALAEALAGLSLPVSVPPELDRAALLQAMRLDKKRADGRLRFTLPEKIGAVRVGVEVSEDLIRSELY